jgi:hypothetical protein
LTRGHLFAEPVECPLCIATRYDKLARNFLAATTLVAVLYWIKLCVQTLAPFPIEMATPFGVHIRELPVTED